MTLYEIAKKNLRRNIKSYVLYLYPMVFSIAIYFTFVSLQYNKQVNNSATTLDKIGPAFMAASLVLFICASLFIWYSNAFFIKRRKREIGLYSLFGMRKKQIARLLFNEIMILGIFALIIGISLGLIFTKLFAMILIKLMGSHIIATFSISTAALFQTSLAFIITILLAAFYNYQVIYRYSLIQLFKAEKKGERLPQTALIWAILSIVFILCGYSILLQPSTSNLWKTHGFLVIFIALLTLLVGTYLFLHAFSIWVLKLLNRYKKISWKGVHFISITSLLYRIRGNVLVLSILALLTTLTLFAMGTTFSLYQNMNNISKHNFPHSFMYTVPSEKYCKRIDEMLTNNGKDNLVYSENVSYIPFKGDMSEVQRLTSEHRILLVSESSYHRLAKRMGIDRPLHLSEHQAIAFYDGNLDQKKDPYTGKNIYLDEQTAVNIASYESYSLFNQDSFILPVVINDQLFEKIKTHSSVSYMRFEKIKNEKSAKDLANNLQKLIYSENSKSMDLQHPPDQYFVSFYHQYQKLSETYGLLVFISSFLGLVFLLATGSMLHYKQLTEAAIDQSRYMILKKVGMNTKQIRLSVKEQVRVIFILPLLIAIAHSSIIITAISNFLKIEMFYPFLSAIGLYIVIYYVYYLLTSSKYNQMVNK
ncbi:ABC transporter permease [Heyndrickxia sporothermodurans]|nr:ABC transporter permease [Heyndrickxia sporothermodurans]